MDQSKSILINLLTHLNNKDIPLDKITIQKCAYFLKEMGLPIKFHFEPYIYGPYSIDLAMELDDMVFWDKLEQTGSSYTIKDLPATCLLEQLQGKLDSKLECLEQILDNRFEFNYLELASTVLFVIRSLEANNEKIDMQSVVKEVKDWKGKKFSDKQIKQVYKKIVELSRKRKCLSINFTPVAERRK